MNGKKIIDVSEIVVYQGSSIIIRDEEEKIYTCGYDFMEVYSGRIRNPICINELENSELSGKKVKNIMVISTEDEYYYENIFFITETEAYVYILQNELN